MWSSLLICFGLWELAPLSRCDGSFTKNLVSQFDVRTAYRNAMVGNSTIPSGCEFMAMYLFNRHGTRLPSSSEIEKINALIRKVNSQGSGTIAREIRAWKNPFVNVTAGALVHVGINEAITIDDYLGNTLDLNSKLNASNVKVYSSASPRVLDSAYAAAMMFGLPNSSITIDNEVSRYYDYCPKYINGVLNNKTAIREYYQFAANPLLTTVINKVKRNLGLPQDVGFTSENLMTLYGICKYDTAVRESSPYSPWCTVFDKSDIDVLEYYADLEYYYLSSYGHSINYLQSCPLVSTLLSLMENVTSGATKTLGIFNFGHVTGHLSLATNLGIIDRPRVPPRADNYASQVNRSFRTSKYCPFAGNLALLLLNCSSFENRGLQVMPLLNQNSITWSLCNSSLCPFETVVKKLEFCTTPEYQYKTLCKFSSSASDASITSTALLLLCGFWYFVSTIS